jgi:hypothetical protein
MVYVLTIRIHNYFLIDKLDTLDLVLTLYLQKHKISQNHKCIVKVTCRVRNNLIKFSRNIKRAFANENSFGVKQ